MKLEINYSREAAMHNNEEKDKELLAQKLKDLEKLFSMDLGSFLVLNEEGREGQIKEAKQKLRSHFLKYGEEMKKEAQGLDSETAQLVEQFLKSIEQILDVIPDQLDPAQLNSHHKLSTILEKVIQKKLE